MAKSGHNNGKGPLSQGGLRRIKDAQLILSCLLLFMSKFEPELQRRGCEQIEVVAVRLRGLHSFLRLVRSLIVRVAERIDLRAYIEGRQQVVVHAGGNGSLKVPRLADRFAHRQKDIIIGIFWLWQIFILLLVLTKYSFLRFSV